MTLTEHLETQLGPIVGGWSQTRAGAELEFQVVLFQNAPMRGACTFATVGLSNELLDQGDGTHIRQELLFLCYDRFRFWDPQNLVAAVGAEVLKSRHALHRGRVLGPRGRLFDLSSHEALYCAVPVYFPRPFHTFNETSPETVFVWLMPITDDEADVVAARGWRAFEEELARRNPDLLDLTRKSVYASARPTPRETR